jgi:oligopeptide transport system substrate-binding protein
VLRLLLPLLLLIGAIAASIAADRPRPRADFTFVNRGDVTTLDLQQISWQQDIRVARIIYEGLVKNNVFTYDYAIEPGMADRWEVSPDKRVYTFHLRDAKWSDGSPVRAEDFFYSWMRGLLPDIAADYTGFLEHIKGGRAFFDWRNRALAGFSARLRESGKAQDADAAQTLWEETRRKFFELVCVSADQTRTIRVELERPTPYFLDMAAFVTLFPLCEPVVRRYEIIDPATARVKWDLGWTKPPRLVTNGPLTVEAWQFKRDLRLKRNPFYWNQSAINIDTISIPTIEDSSASIVAFETGAVDWVSDVLAPFRAEMVAKKREYYSEHRADYEALKARGLDPIEIDRRLPPDRRKNVHVFPAFGTYFLNFNCSPDLPDGRANPLSDPRVRRALAMAVDKSAIADGLRRVGEPVAATLIPPDSIAGYHSPRGLGFDPPGARDLLAQAGYPGGKGFITLDLLVTKDGGHELIAQSIAKDWERNLGISTTITVQEIKAFRERLKGKNYMTTRASWFGDYGDPTTFLEINRSGDGNNDRAYSSPAFDRLLDQAADETDPAKRMQILERAERVIVEEDLPLLPIFHYVNMFMFDANKLTGISSHPRGDQQLYRVDIFGDGKGHDTPITLPPRTPGVKQSGESGL